MKPIFSVCSTLGVMNQVRFRFYLTVNNAEFELFLLSFAVIASGEPSFLIFVTIVYLSTPSQFELVCISKEVVGRFGLLESRWKFLGLVPLVDHYACLSLELCAHLGA
jgi:hypothetical protein